MKRSYFRSRVQTVALTALAWLCASAAAVRDPTMLTDIELASGVRGLALALKGSGPFGEPAIRTERNAGGSVVVLVISQCRFGQAAARFTDFPSGCPVRGVELTASAGAATTTIRLDIATASARRGAPRMQGNRLLLLLSDSTFPSTQWHASLPPGSGPPLPGSSPAGMSEAPAPPSAAIGAVSPSARGTPRHSLPAAETIAGSAASRAESPPGPGAAPVFYTVYGRDPFIPYSRQEDKELANAEILELVGIIYSGAQRIAVLENPLDRRQSFALHEKDPVQRGSLLRIMPGSVTFLLTEMGISRTFTLELRKDGGTRIY